VSRIPDRGRSSKARERKVDRRFANLGDEVAGLETFFERSHSSEVDGLDSEIQGKLDEMEFERGISRTTEAVSSDPVTDPTEVVMFNNSSYSSTIGASQALDGTKVLLLDPTAVVGDGSSNITAIGAGEITLQPGIYTISVNFFFGSTGTAHNCVAMQLGIGGVGTGPVGASGYISRAGGHANSSLHLVEYAIEVPNTTSRTIEIWFGNLSTVTAGTVTSAAGDSTVTIKRHADIS